jgi:hypothetical protein
MLTRSFEDNVKTIFIQRNVSKTLTNLSSALKENGFILIEEITSNLPIGFSSEQLWEEPLEIDDDRSCYCFCNEQKWCQIFDENSFDINVPFCEIELIQRLVSFCARFITRCVGDIDHWLRIDQWENMFITRVCVQIILYRSYRLCAIMEVKIQRLIQ